MKAPRDALGEVLIDLGKKYEELVVLNSDLSSATKTASFANEFPKRHFNMGICEQNMMSVAAGLASEGFIPIATTFAIFATGRAYDQVRQCIAYGGNNVKIAATHPGLAVGGDGGTHQALEDISLMSSLANMVVLAPYDDIETKKAIIKAIEYDGPVYIRVGRVEVPTIHKEDYDFKIGKGEILREGKDVTLICHGIMTLYSLQAAEKLACKGIEAEVINMASIKPIDNELILSSVKKTGYAVTVEDHSIYGGLGSIVASFLSSTYPVFVDIIGVNDKFGESGDKEELYRAHGLDVDSIVHRIKFRYDGVK